MNTPKENAPEVNIDDWDDDEPTMPTINLKTLKTPVPTVARVGWRDRLSAWFGLLLIRLGLR